MSQESKCLAILNSILAENAGKRVDGSVASDLTSSGYTDVLKKCFRQLYELGFKLSDPHNLSEKHVEALCRRWHSKGISPATMKGELSRLRIFGGWIGKDNMVKSLETYLPDVDPAELRVTRVAKVSKSWTENGIDVAAKIKEADDLDWRFGLMLRMSLAFGLRRIEVVQLKPWKSDKGDKLAVYEAKNGRPRDVYIDTEQQRAVLDFIKTKITRKTGFLGWDTTERGKPSTLEYSVGRYNRCMAKIGITKDEVDVSGHGLRAQFAENAALIAQMIPPTLGGTAGQMAREDLNVKRAQVSELLGHSRIAITSSYYGSFGRGVAPDDANRYKETIERALQKYPREALRTVPTERILDCVMILLELTLLEIAINLPEIQMLWELHSQRHAVKWCQPTKENAAAIEAAALRVLKEMELAPVKSDV